MKDELKFVPEDLKRVHNTQQTMQIVRIEGKTFAPRRKMDEQRRKLAEDHNAREDMLSMSRKVLTDAVTKKLNSIKAKAYGLLRCSKGVDGLGRSHYRPNDLVLGPWSVGEVLVLNENLPEIKRRFAAIKKEMDDELRELEQQWELLMSQCKTAAGDFYHPNDLPSFTEFAEGWSLNLYHYSLPSEDTRFSLNQHQVQDIMTQTTEMVVDKMGHAVLDATEQMLTNLKYVAAVLGNDHEKRAEMTGNPKASGKKSAAIYQSMFDNMAGQVRACRSLAEAFDLPDVRKLCDNVTQTMGWMSAEHFRNNKADRERMARHAARVAGEAEEVLREAQDEVNDVMNKLGGFS